MNDTFLYFAYGSNMLSRRLKAANRAPSAEPVGTGFVLNYTLTFNKRSTDGSGECDMQASADSGAMVRGVLYRISAVEKRALDRAEGVGYGYREGVVDVHFGEQAVFLPEALLLLGLEPDAYRIDGPKILGSVVDTLVRPAGGLRAALVALRQAVVQLGGEAPESWECGRRAATDRATRLVGEARSRRASIPGMTIHQAKGREWNHVGIRLNSAELGFLKDGLDPTQESHRTLYVALTRARDSVTLVD